MLTEVTFLNFTGFSFSFLQCQQNSAEKTSSRKSSLTCEAWLFQIRDDTKPHGTGSTNNINDAFIHVLNIVVICDTTCMYNKNGQHKTVIVGSRHYHSNRVSLE